MFPFGGGGGLFGDGGSGGIFVQRYKCFPVAFFASQSQRDPATLEASDKILLPPSALSRLSNLNISFPMLFEVSAGQRRIHCGVLEFVAEETMAYLPSWVMQNLQIREGDMISVKSVNIPKGSYVKLQPQSSSFLEMSNPKAVLETNLRNFSALTKGEIVRIYYNQRHFDIAVVDLRPGDAVSIIETDIEVDFAPPADAPQSASGPVSGAAAGSGVRAAAPGASRAGKASGKGFSFGGVKVPATSGESAEASAGSAASTEEDSAEPVSNEDYFARLGGGVTVKGRAVGTGSAAGFSSGARAAGPVASVQQSAPDTESAAEDGDGSEGSKFEAFSGKGFSLR